MNLQDIFNINIIEHAKTLYNQENVVILSETENTIKAVVHDGLFYNVTLKFNDDGSIKAMHVSDDNITPQCPYSTPYAAATLIKLMINNKFNITCACKLEPVMTSSRLTSTVLSHTPCYNKVLNSLLSYIIPLQNYRTDKDIRNHNYALEQIFDYFDSLENSTSEQWVAIQTFMHLYMSLPFNFNRMRDVHYGVIDECNYRINHIFESVDGNLTKGYFESILKNDTEVSPYLQLDKKLTNGH
jgi:hypothetical protein